MTSTTDSTSTSPLIQSVLLLAYHANPPVILWQYDFQSNIQELPLCSLAEICCPLQEKPTKCATEFAFCMPIENKQAIYGYVRQLFIPVPPQNAMETAPKVRNAVCILSSLPHYSVLAWVARIFHARFLLDQSNKANEALYKQLEGYRAEDLIRHHEVTFTNSVFSLNAKYKLPILDEGKFSTVLSDHQANVDRFVQKISPSLLLLMLSAVLCEKRIVLVSADIELLRGGCHALISLIRPYHWMYLYVPVLSARLLKKYIHCPTPFIFGVTSIAWKSMDLKGVKDVTVFDFQSKSVELVRLKAVYPTLCPKVPKVMPSAKRIPFSSLDLASSYKLGGLLPRLSSAFQSYFLDDKGKAYSYLYYFLARFDKPPVVPQSQRSSRGDTRESLSELLKHPESDNQTRMFLNYFWNTRISQISTQKKSTSKSSRGFESSKGQSAKVLYELQKLLQMDDESSIQDHEILKYVTEISFDMEECSKLMALCFSMLDSSQLSQIPPVNQIYHTFEVLEKLLIYGTEVVLLFFLSEEDKLKKYRHWKSNNTAAVKVRHKSRYICNLLSRPGLLLQRRNATYCDQLFQDMEYPRVDVTEGLSFQELHRVCA